MKKVFVSVSRSLSGFLIALTVLAFLPLYMMYVIPIIYWTSGATFGELLVHFLESDYLVFFLFPFSPFLVACFALSVFVWIYNQNDKEVGKVGFRNTLLCIFSIFFLVLLPAKASQFSHKIQEQKDKETARLHTDDGTVYVNKGINKEFLKLYQSLSDEGIQPWRKDPVAVVKHELENGDLTFLSRTNNELTLKLIDAYEPNGPSRAVVSLTNERFQVEIQLSQYWESTNGIWLVKSYKIQKK